MEWPINDLQIWSFSGYYKMTVRNLNTNFLPHSYPTKPKLPIFTRKAIKLVQNISM